MLRRLLEETFSLISRYAAEPEDSEEWRIKKTIGIYSVLFAIPILLGYGLLYNAFNERLAGLVTGSTVVLFCLGLLSYHLFRNYAAHVYFWMGTFTVSITLSHVLLGGFAQSGMVIIWLLLCPVTAIVVYKTRPGFALFLLGTIILLMVAVLQPYYQRDMNNVPPMAIKALFTANFLGLGIFMILSVYYYVLQVEQKNRELETEHEKLHVTNEKLKRATAAAESANQAKSDFLNTVSHELRTPLTSILGFARIIRKKFDESIFPAIRMDDKKIEKSISQVRSNIDIILAEGERLTTLINDVLDLAKMEAGRTEWKMDKVNVEDILVRSQTAAASLFEQKGLTLILDVENQLPAVTGDKDRFIQVMLNLISNAVKFTPQGSVTCAARTMNNELVLSVADSGIGLSKEDQPKVFEKFKQVGDTLMDKPSGTGLGLPICKEIVEHYGGRIWVESEPGKGCTFSFTIPFEKSGADTGVEGMDMNALVQRLRDHEATSPAGAKPGEKTVLIVDDDASIRELLRQELEAQGYRVREAVDGADGVRQAKESPPDLVILDVMMPGMNGFDAAAVLKGDPATMRTPILILSVIEDRERGYRIGVDRYLTKPVEADALLREVGSLIAQGASKKKVMVVDDNASTVKTLSELLVAKGYQVVAACNGSECIDKAVLERPDMIIIDAVLSDRHNVVKTLRFEKGLENVYFVFAAGTK